MEFNKYQTPLDSDLVKSLDKEIYNDLLDYLDSIIFISRLISKDRPTVDKLPKDEDDKIIVDITNPHILENMDYFRQPAIHFEKHGVYTLLTPNSNPKSEYAKFWKEEMRRWREGMLRPDGEWIPGSLYFYWNYCPIWQEAEEENSLRAKSKKKKGRGRGSRVRKFPKPWLGDYLFFHYLDQAENYVNENTESIGAHAKLLKARGVGFSFKLASLSPRNMYIRPGTGNPNFHLASDKTFLSGDKGVFGKVLDTLDWIADHTPFPRLRLIDSKRSMEIQLGYLDDYGRRKGLLSSVHGISLKHDPDKARGIRGPLIHYEEDGLFPDLEHAWNVNRKAVEDGNIATGFMIAGGCLTKNNLVWNNKGELVPINKLNIEDGILGFNQSLQKISKEDITYWQSPTKKECVKLTTNTGRTLECSLDHPILWSHQQYFKRTELPQFEGKRRRLTKKSVTFKEAGNIKVGDQIATVNEVDIFPIKEMWEPRVVGWLIGDGSYDYNKTPVISNCEIEINNYIESNFDHIIERQYLTKLGKLYKETRIKGITKNLRDLGIYGQTKLDKRLPKNFHSYSKHSMSEVIGGLFDTDGYVDGKGTISISQAGKDILLELQLALQKFGIHGNINFKKPNLKNPKSRKGHYELEIRDKSSVVNFVNNIKLSVKEKQDRLDSYLELYKNIKTQNTKHLEGIRFERVVSIENIGIQEVYNLTAGTTHTYIGNGIITHNTGGTEGGDFEGSEKLFYFPEGYNIYGVPNVYDRNTDGNTKCGFFWGAYLNRNGCYDEESGEPDVIKALVQILKDRFLVKRTSSDSQAITQKKAEECITPQDAILRLEGTIFPVADLKDYLADVMPNVKNFIAPHYVGDLNITPSGETHFILNPDKTPIRDFPLKDNLNKIGAIEIFQRPKKRLDGTIPKYRYIGGCDTYDDDYSTTTSLGSVFIFDRLTDSIVAEYTGRPQRAKDFYEIVLRLAKYYNAIINYENDKKGLFGYFNNQRALQYLCETPTFLKAMEFIKDPRSYGNKAVGTPSGVQINALGRRLQADWLQERAFGEQSIIINDEGEEEEVEVKLNMHKVRSIGYLKELIAWHPDINADRVSAMGMTMILREEMLSRDKNEFHTHVKNVADDPFFKRHGEDKYNRERYRSKINSLKNLNF